MDSDVIHILVFAHNAQLGAIDTALQALGINVAITVVEDPAQAEHYLAMHDQWSLVLCNLLMFSTSGFRRGLQQARPKLLAPVVVLQAPTQQLTVDAVFEYGADDIVSLGNANQLRAVAQREIGHAQIRRTLSALQAAHPAPGETTDQMDTAEAAAEQSGTPGALSAQHERIYHLLNSRAVTLQYQGIATIASHDAEFNLYEVFVRLVDEQGELVYPGDFFPIARQFQLIPRIDLTVVQQAIAILEQKHREGEACTRLFIKLSEETIGDKRYCNGIISLIASARIPRGSLVVELGKTCFSNYPQQINLMHATLNRRGHVLSFDACNLEDCEGMQAFSPLLGYLKLNRPLVDGIIGDQDKRQRLGQFIACATNEGLKTIASRIEHADVLPLLYSVGVTHIQGHFVGEIQHEPSGEDSVQTRESFETPLYCLN
jgi:EAL domain-containing protein (putative c-di-GMP-specific phosphodiesterase class I)/CheY-like chemotaxis protein